MNLYNLVEAFRAIGDVLNDPESDDAEIESALTLVDEAKGDLNTKVDTICRTFRGIDLDIEKIKREEERLRKRRKALENRRDRLREWVRLTMSVLDVPKIKTELFTASLVKAKPYLTVVDESAIPEEYKKIVVEIRKAEMNTAFRTLGIIPPGTAVLLGEPELRIR